ncbi:MAG: zinc ribbon domain-containing protein [bacterium]|nr:zinc ribbon domain-containing protein [bacterium]
MPLYVYHCPDCGRELELLRPVSQRDDALRCEQCGHDRVVRSGASFASAVHGSPLRGGVVTSSCGGGGGFT